MLQNLIFRIMIQRLGNWKVKSPFWGVNENLTVNIGNRVKIIPDCIFVLTNVKNLNLSEGLEHIESQAFQACENLTTVTIPSTVTGIDVFAFSDCLNLATINYNAIDASESKLLISNSAYPPFISLNNNLTINIGKNVRVIPSFLFAACPVSTLNIEEGLEEIGQQSFYRCLNLRSVVIPSTITSINSIAFDDCTNLSTITIRKSENSITGAPWTNVAGVGVIWAP